MEQQWVKPVEWLDKSTSFVNLDECRNWSADSSRIMAAYLYRCSAGRYFMDASGHYIEIPPSRAAILLLRWGRQLPSDLIVLLKEEESSEATLGPTLPLPKAISSDGSVKLFGKEDQPIVLDKPKPVLSPAQYDVVLPLVKISPDGLSKYLLVSHSCRGSARDILKRIKDSDFDWNAVIHFPGTSHRQGYWIGKTRPREIASAASA